MSSEGLGDVSGSACGGADGERESRGDVLVECTVEKGVNVVSGMSECGYDGATVSGSVCDTGMYE